MDYQSTIQFRVENEELHGVFFSKDNIRPSVFLMHGGGVLSSNERTLYLSNRLLAKDIPTFAFDFSGHGKSTGDLKESSLKKRQNEAINAICHADISKPLTIVGASMSGYTAIKLIEDFDIKNLILFCPAVYDEKAYKIKFNEGFTEIIRKKESWRNSDAFSTLNKFSGNLLIIIGEDDQVIPEGVIDLIDQYSSRAKKKEIIKIPNCNHLIHNWFNNHPEDADRITQKIADFIK